MPLDNDDDHLALASCPIPRPTHLLKPQTLYIYIFIISLYAVTIQWLIIRNIIQALEHFVIAAD